MNAVYGAEFKNICYLFLNRREYSSIGRAFDFWSNGCRFEPSCSLILPSYWQIYLTPQPVASSLQWFYFYFYFYQLCNTHLSGRGRAFQHHRYMQLFLKALPAGVVPRSLEGEHFRVDARPKLRASRGIYLRSNGGPWVGTGLSVRRPLFVERGGALPFFHLYLTLARAVSVPFVVHTAFRDMFIVNSDYRALSFASIPKLVSRWRNTHHLLLNLFYAQIPILAFTHKALRDEALAFNWSCHRLSYSVFKYAAPYFFLKNTPHGDMVYFVFRRLDKERLNTAFVSDVHYHRSTTFHLKKSNFYTFGAVPATLNPWVVQYPIMVGSCTLFTQYFFLKLLIHFRGEAERLIFAQWLDIWTQV